jgi:hypothetical protein
MMGLFKLLFDQNLIIIDYKFNNNFNSYIIINKIQINLLELLFFFLVIKSLFLFTFYNVFSIITSCSPTSAYGIFCCNNISNNNNNNIYLFFYISKILSQA